MIGAGFMARGVALQVAQAFRGSIRIAGIANRTLEKARQAYAEAGEDDVSQCRTAAEVRAALAEDRAIITSDPLLLAAAEGIDVLLEVTGAVEDALPPVLAAIEARSVSWCFTKGSISKACRNNRTVGSDQ